MAGGVVRTICQLAGVQNISSKLLSRSRNKLNIARATIAALKQLKVEKKDEELKVEKQETTTPIKTKQEDADSPTKTKQKEE